MTDVAVSYGKSFLGVFCWAWPRSSCCFVALETKRKSGWGICGSSLFVFLRFCVMICPFTGTGQLSCVPPFSPLMSLSGPCHRAFTAKLEEKKKQPVKLVASHQYESISFSFGFLGVSVLILVGYG